MFINDCRRNAMQANALRDYAHRIARALKWSPAILGVWMAAGVLSLCWARGRSDIAPIVAVRQTLRPGKMPVVRDQASHCPRAVIRRQVRVRLIAGQTAYQCVQPGTAGSPSAARTPSADRSHRNVRAHCGGTQAPGEMPRTHSTNSRIHPCSLLGASLMPIQSTRGRAHRAPSCHRRVS